MTKAYLKIIEHMAIQFKILIIMRARLILLKSAPEQFELSILQSAEELLLSFIVYLIGLFFFLSPYTQ